MQAKLSTKLIELNSQLNFTKLLWLTWLKYRVYRFSRH